MVCIKEGEIPWVNVKTFYFFLILEDRMFASNYGTEKKTFVNVWECLKKEGDDSKINIFKKGLNSAPKKVGGRSKQKEKSKTIKRKIPITSYLNKWYKQQRHLPNKNITWFR